MSIMQAINITMLILCGTICLILLICVATSEYRKEKLNTIFISLVCCHMPLLIVDALIVIIEGSSGFYRSLIFRTAYCISFVMGCVLLMLFTRYLLTFIGLKTAISKRTVTVSYVAIIACAVNIVLIMLTQIFGLYYTITTSNTSVPGNLYWLSQLLAVMCIFINTWIMISYRKCLERREFVFFLSYSILPVLALVVHNCFDGIIVSIDVSITLTILIFYAGIQSELAKHLKTNEIELLETSVSIMLSQIQPHFLFNSLLSIQDLCEQENASQSENAVKEFSKYLRGNLNSLTYKRTISFEKELEHTRIYLSLEQKRFEERLNVVFDIQATGFRIPALSLQSIVENAVRHGITKCNEGGTITIRTAEEENHHVITIEDNGIGFSKDALMQDNKTHIGIKNVRSRLEIMSRGTLEINSTPGEGTLATITIPKGSEAE